MLQSLSRGHVEHRVPEASVRQLIQRSEDVSQCAGRKVPRLAEANSANFQGNDLELQSWGYRVHRATVRSMHVSDKATPSIQADLSLKICLACKREFLDQVNLFDRCRQ
jgi:hypothetical protein